MFKNYFKTTFRHLWRQRLFTALNILGLAISISACWVIYCIVSYEFSYEKNLPGKENIYRVLTGFVFDEKEQYNGGVSKPMYQGIRQEIVGIDYTVPLLGAGLKALQVNYSNGKPLMVDEPENVAATDSTYFTMLPYHWLAGNKRSAFTAPNSVVLTESRAKKYFPNQKLAGILNQTITYYGYQDTVTRTITGIVADYPTPTEFTTQEFCSLPAKAYEMAQWTNTNGSDKLYLQLKQGVNPAEITAKIDSLSAKKRRAFEATRTDNFKYKQWYELLPLKESHFATMLQWEERKASKPVLYGLMGIALFLLLLACINYINMSIAGLPQRAKEIGVRKTLGSSRSRLISQFLSETFITTILAGVSSFVLSQLGFWLLSDIIPQGITPFANVWQLIIFIIILAIIVTVLAGLYPGWLITKVKAVNVFRNTSLRQKNSSGFSLQKALIVFQFVIALVFITSAIIVAKQLQYVLNSDMGFNKDAVVLADVPWKYASNKNYAGKQFTLLAELKNIPGVQNAALGDAPMSRNYSSSQYDYTPNGKEPVSRQVFRKEVDTAYLRLYGMKLVAGRNIYASDTTNEYVINETAVHAFGFASPQDALGKMIGQQHAKFPIVGVVKDFHQQNFYTTIDPMAFESDKEGLSSFNIKLAGDPSRWQKTLKAIEKTWYQFYPPESFTYKFYDEAIANMYQQEENLAKLINLATAISIFISCLGLFGIAVLTAFQRTKEIGIRKVLGASVAGIVQLLSKEYVVLVIIATLIASPLVWWAMNKWLQKFAYRISIEWWMFLLAGMVALLLALITVSFQVIKAARVNPVKSLKTE
ncbi:ABC transporter permease [Parafilimonas sp.]|uniref:ABC transporter permease n=1 Tax=Parafilimonas sp. TaxID=1969739 RepID=UPI003F813741